MSERYHCKGNGIWYDIGSDPEEFRADDVIDIYLDHDIQCTTVLLKDGTKIIPDFTYGGDYVENTISWYVMILRTTERFSELPEPAQKLLTVPYVPYRVAIETIRQSSECKSPIEEILFVAIKLMGYCRRNDFKVYDDNGDIVVSYGAMIYPQHEIQASGHTYFLDFLILVVSSENFFKDYAIADYDNIFLAVECDGHDYHHISKEQVSQDYERELAIKMSGIDVIRFTGSQIYNDPKKCADEVGDYIIASINRKRWDAEMRMRRENNGDLQNDSDGILDRSGCH